MTWWQWLLIVVVVIAVLVFFSAWPDIRRYLHIRRM
jgi:hypothetical protein